MLRALPLSQNAGEQLGDINITWSFVDSFLLLCHLFPGSGAKNSLIMSEDA